MASYTSASRVAGSLRSTLDQKEVHLYGSSRLGIDQMDRDTLFLTPSGQYEFIRNPFSANMIIYRKLVAPSEAPRVLSAPSATGRSLGDTLGQKRYELSNHLGNVLAVISDKRIIKGCGRYEAELHQATDYYPFGSPMPGRSITLGNNPAVSKHRLAPAFFKQQKYYAIDGKKTLYLYYPHIPAGGGAPFDYVLRCTTTTPPGLVTYELLGSTSDRAGVEAFANLINATPLKATAVVGQQEIVPGALFDVIAITFGPELARVPYKDISFSGSTGGDPFHLFVNPGNDTDDDYRYGFNGKENDAEIAWQDYGERMYDPRVGRFPSSDPLIVYGQQYAELSSYQFASNTPIMGIDLDGLEVFTVTAKKTTEINTSQIDVKKAGFIAYKLSFSIEYPAEGDQPARSEPLNTSEPIIMFDNKRMTEGIYSPNALTVGQTYDLEWLGMASFRGEKQIHIKSNSANHSPHTFIHPLGTTAPAANDPDYLETLGCKGVAYESRCKIAPTDESTNHIYSGAPYTYEKDALSGLPRRTDRDSEKGYGESWSNSIKSMQEIRDIYNKNQNKLQKSDNFELKVVE